MEETESPRRIRRRKKLVILLLRNGGSAKMERETGTPKSYFSAVRSGARGLGDKLAAKLENFYGLTPGWFDSDEDMPQPVWDEEGNRLPTEAVSAMEERSELLADQSVRVPLLANAASMGPGADAQGEDALAGSLSLTPSFVSNHVRPSKFEALRFIHGHGDSMAPTFNSGDVLLVDTGINEVKIDGIYVLEAHDRLFIKRVRQRMDGTYEVSSDNPTHKTTDTLNGDHSVTVKGRVLWAWNGRKL